MIKIRSTETLATSNSYGLCDVLRQMLSFRFYPLDNTFTTIVQDTLFQEQEATINQDVLDENGDITGSEEVNIIERMIIEKKQAKAYTYNMSLIDGFHSELGTSITKTDGFSKGLTENLKLVLIAETVKYTRQGMSNWVDDTEHVVVNKFS